VLATSQKSILVQILAIPMPSTHIYSQK